jgi:hypothetical protein
MDGTERRRWDCADAGMQRQETRGWLGGTNRETDERALGRQQRGERREMRALDCGALPLVDQHEASTLWSWSSGTVQAVEQPFNLVNNSIWDKL